MADRTSRATAALEDVVAVEHYGPGMARVVTWSDSYVVDVRDSRCECPDMEYHLEGEGKCKHVWAAALATDRADLSLPGIELRESLDERLAVDVGEFPDFDEFEMGVEYA